mmetsp:Transcript_11040/g.20615  ORF Transcript_11040/g.20615 Transcript_11040/m.20615 type:complete len:711 (-) Transcript_11040:74-2206(-)
MNLPNHIYLYSPFLYSSTGDSTPPTPQTSNRSLTPEKDNINYRLYCLENGLRSLRSNQELLQQDSSHNGLLPHKTLSSRHSVGNSFSDERASTASASNSSSDDGSIQSNMPFSFLEKDDEDNTNNVVSIKTTTMIGNFDRKSSIETSLASTATSASTSSSSYGTILPYDLSLSSSSSSSSRSSSDDNKTPPIRSITISDRAKSSSLVTPSSPVSSSHNNNSNNADAREAEIITNTTPSITTTSSSSTKTSQTTTSPSHDSAIQAIQIETISRIQKEIFTLKIVMSSYPPQSQAWQVLHSNLELAQNDLMEAMEDADVAAGCVFIPPSSSRDDYGGNNGEAASIGNNLDPSGSSSSSDDDDDDDDDGERLLDELLDDFGVSFSSSSISGRSGGVDAFHGTSSNTSDNNDSATTMNDFGISFASSISEGTTTMHIIDLRNNNETLSIRNVDEEDVAAFGVSFASSNDANSTSDSNSISIITQQQQQNPFGISFMSSTSENIRDVFLASSNTLDSTIMSQQYARSASSSNTASASPFLSPNASTFAAEATTEKMTKIEKEYHSLSMAIRMAPKYSRMWTLLRTYMERAREELDAIREDMEVCPHTIHIMAPSGEDLGLVVDRLLPDDDGGGPVYISGVDPTSPLRDQVQLNDKIVAIDGKDLQGLSSVEVRKLLASCIDNGMGGGEQRRISIVRGNNITGVAKKNGSLGAGVF